MNRPSITIDYHNDQKKMLPMSVADFKIVNFTRD